MHLHPFQEQAQLPAGPQRPPAGSEASEGQRSQTPPLIHHLPPEVATLSFPKASRASEVKEERFALRSIWVEQGTLTHKIQAGPISHLLDRESQGQKAKPRGITKTRGLAMTRAQELGEGDAGLEAVLGGEGSQEPHWWIQVSVCLLPAPFHCPIPASGGKWPRWPGQERCQRGRWEKGLVDCKLSIMA